MQKGIEAAPEEHVNLDALGALTELVVHVADRLIRAAHIEPVYAHGVALGLRHPLREGPFELPPYRLRVHREDHKLLLADRRLGRGAEQERQSQNGQERKPEEDVPERTLQRAGFARTKHVGLPRGPGVTQVRQAPHFTRFAPGFKVLLAASPAHVLWLVVAVLIAAGVALAWRQWGRGRWAEQHAKRQRAQPATTAPPPPGSGAAPEPAR